MELCNVYLVGPLKDAKSNFRPAGDQPASGTRQSRPRRYRAVALGYCGRRARWYYPLDPLDPLWSADLDAVQALSGSAIRGACPPIRHYGKGWKPEVGGDPRHAAERFSFERQQAQSSGERPSHFTSAERRQPSPIGGFDSKTTSMFVIPCACSRCSISSR